MPGNPSQQHPLSCRSIRNGAYAIARYGYHTRNRKRSPESCDDSWAKSHLLWIGGTAFRSDRLAEAFALAAMYKPFCKHGPPESNMFPQDQKLSLQRVLKLAGLFHTLDNLTNEPFYIIEAEALESQLDAKMLQAMQNDGFPAMRFSRKNQYVNYIPII